MPEIRTPVFFVVMAGPHPALRSGDREVFGAFTTEDDAVLWVSKHLPDRVIFTVVPVFDVV